MWSAHAMRSISFEPIKISPWYTMDNVPRVHTNLVALKGDDFTAVYLVSGPMNLSFMCFLRAWSPDHISIRTILTASRGKCCVQLIGQQFSLATEWIEFSYNLRSKRVVDMTCLLLVELYCLRDMHILLLLRFSYLWHWSMRSRLTPSYWTRERGQRHTKNLQSSRRAACSFDWRMNTPTSSASINAIRWLACTDDPYGDSFTVLCH
jgi:hypothetical protein